MWTCETCSFLGVWFEMITYKTRSVAGAFLLCSFGLLLLFTLFDVAFGELRMKWKPPMLPVFISVDSAGNLTVGGEASITTFLGTFALGADYSVYSQPGYTTVVVRNLIKNNEQAYKVKSGSDELTVFADGKTRIEIKDKWVLIQVRGTTNIRFKQAIKKPQKRVTHSAEMPKDNSSPSIEFTSMWPTKRGEIDYDHVNATYDWIYRDLPHWKITHYNGYMEFRFRGKKNFFYYALGSAKNDVSYCDVIVYVNGRTITRKHIDLGWKTYRISSQEFGEGENTVKIELVGDTHFWIRKVWVSPNK